MVKVAAISYLNTIPFIYGLKNHHIKDEIDLQLCTPSNGAKKIIDNRADVGIIPVASTFYIPNYKVVSDYCIGAIDKVASVLLSSNFHISQIKNIYLDTESMTSVTLIKVLVKHFFKINVNYKAINFSMLSKNDLLELAAKDANAFVIIGDKAMSNASFFKYNLDLASQWIAFSSKPMVFALWISNKDLPVKFVDSFNAALKFGVEHIKEAVNEQNVFDKDMAYRYLNNNISYPFDKPKQEGLKSFLNFAKEELL